ncbi:type VII secretion protein EssB/YukC [Mesobacillus foraminis]|uniref:Putative membrane protein YukC n=1 Tax=Mesobacillus foraminis TaxID=279826 RepID=A0A4R2AWS4_9BACI|nr:type VII secretion protein EssB/YukC [Mesobacillus foraminis]TCN18448.1 putative membrane protein YukC [Mesobacillus foraminis]
MKIQLFEHGTLFIEPNKHYRLEIPENKVLAERVEELKDLQGDFPSFFPLHEINKENGRFVFRYEVEEGYKPLTDAKGYSTVMRLALIHGLLDLDPLDHFREHVLIHPRNIFFKDLKSLKFLYRANRWLPSEHHLDKLEQYKVLILSMFSRFSFEKYKREKGSLLRKEEDEFLFRIENACNLGELKDLIEKRLYQEETEHFLTWEEEKRKIRKQKGLLFGTTAGICGVAFAFGLILQQSAVDKVQSAYASELKKAEGESHYYRLLSEEKYDEALLLLKKNGGTKEEVANIFLEKGEYQEAIDTDQSFIKPAVEALYRSNQQEQIMGLESDSDYLEIEKEIIAYDYSSLLSKQAFSTDKGQLLRMGKAFAEHGDLQDAKSLNNRLKDKELADMIRKKELENRFTAIQEEIKEINEKKGLKQEQKRKEIKPKQVELTKIRDEIKKIEKETG